MKTGLGLMIAVMMTLLPMRAWGLDVTKTVQGAVKHLSASSIEVVSVPDGHNVRLAVDSNTVYNNIQKLSELKTGDTVQIQYQQSQGVNVATSITKMEVENL